MEDSTRSRKLHKSSTSVSKNKSERYFADAIHDITAKRSTDEVFAEYLRVINGKDETIHQLLVEIEKLNLELKTKGDADKENMRGLVKTLERLKETTLGFAPKEVELSRLRKKNDRLMKDVEALRESLLLSEDKVKSAVKAHSNITKEIEVQNEKQKNREKELEKSLNHALRKVALLDSQLKVSKQDAEKISLRWKVDFQRLQEESSEVERVNRDLKEQIGDMRPSKSVEKEISQLESRHRSVVDSLGDEVKHAQEKMRFETAKANKLEKQVVELSNQLDDSKRDLFRLQKSYQDSEHRLVQIGLEKSQSLQELQDEYNEKIRGLQHTIDEYYSERGSLEGELAIARRRISDMESSASHANKRFLEDEQQYKEELSSAKQKLNSSMIEIDALKRQTEHQQAKLDAEALKSSELKMQLKISVSENERNDDLNKQLQESYTKEQDYRIRIQSMENSLRDYENTINELRDNNAQLLRNIKRINSEKEQLSADFDVKYRYIQEELESSRRQCGDLMKQVETDNVREKTAATTIQELEHSILKLKESIKEKDHRVETLNKEILGASVINSGLREEQELARTTIARERKEKEDLQQMKILFENVIHKKEYDIAELNSTVRRVEKSANDHEEELSRQLDQTRERVQTLVKDLHSSQQEITLNRIERSKIETRTAEQIATIEKNVVEPLKRQNEEMIQANNKYLKDITSLSENIVSHKRDAQRMEEVVQQLRIDVANRDRKINSLETERDAMRSVEVDCRKVKKELMIEKENNKRIELLEQQLALLSNDLQNSREKELSTAAEASNNRSEALSWKERCENLESLKKITEASVAEYQKREKEMLVKIEEMHRAHQDMQFCFEKQNEQVELGRRLREQDAQRGPRH